MSARGPTPMSPTTCRGPCWGRRGVACAAVAGLVAAACGGGGGGSRAATRDAGADGGSTPFDAASVCDVGDVFCGGVCLPESVDSCGPSCTVCAQPAPSH